MLVGSWRRREQSSKRCGMDSSGVEEERRDATCTIHSWCAKLGLGPSQSAPLPWTAANTFAICGCLLGRPPSRTPSPPAAKHDTPNALLWFSLWRDHWHFSPRPLCAQRTAVLGVSFVIGISLPQSSTGLSPTSQARPTPTCPTPNTKEKFIHV